ncbi:MAG: M61 family peptidase [Myxococcales bacterium]|nr:M61 family peptidase [Myxococcales bacterium]MDH5565812.1 M61 family peptidase [Myxococcales bacterium]
MQLERHLSAVIALTVLACFLPGAPATAERASQPIDLHVDMSRAPQRILHARLALPVQPGPLTLLYPQWMPGEHGPTGPVADLVGLVISAKGKPIPWNRDSRDMFTFHVEVPPGVERLDIELDYLPPLATGMFGNGPATSDQVAVMSWNTMLLYPAGRSIHELTYRPSLDLPRGWSFATSLRQAKRKGDAVHFEDVSLAELIDAPVTTGAHTRALDLTGTAPVPHRLHLVGDSAAALEIRPETEAAFRKLVSEAIALFDSHHYRTYDFLLTLSDHIDSFGLEHHESSDNRLPERALIDDAPLHVNAGLLPHEFVHSWNAKYRRPVGLTRDDYQEPFEADLLWVYEGLTSYLGDVLTARSGLWTPEYARDSIAFIAAELANRPGRRWRPLVDTTRAAYLLYGAPPEWKSWRRGVDFYNEGVLIWLEVDTLIRSLTEDRKSLDDFCRAFTAGDEGRPAVRPFAYAEVTRELGKIAAYDWEKFFADRVYAVRAEAPLAGISNGGWRLVYTETPNLLQKDYEETGDALDLRPSLGLLIGTGDGAENGHVLDVLPGSPAAKPDIAPGATLVAVNGRRWSPDILRRAITEAKDSKQPIRLLVENAEFFREVAVDYHGGERYPHLERLEDEADRLSEILAARTP